MKFFVPVLDYPSGRPLMAPLEGEAFMKLVLNEVDRNFSQLRREVSDTSRSAVFRGEIKRLAEDRGDPRKAGWTYLLHGDDPRRDEIIEALAPLGIHRGMENPKEPLLFDGRDSMEWNDWLEDAYSTLKGKRRPLYMLLAGSPEFLPFELQSYLDVAAAVGRIDFDDMADYHSYVAKVIRHDDTQAELCNHRALVFATDAGPSDPTYYSHEFMAKPLADFIQKKGFDTQTLFGSDATKESLRTALHGSRPALVYTASHGFAAFSQPDRIQRRINGAIQCQRTGTSISADDFLFGAADVPGGGAFLEGSVFFQFACLGYGTPAESHFAHWFPEVSAKHAEGDFVAALPKHLLAHPKGPVAFIGHLDLAFMHGFTDEDAPDLWEPWHKRLEPFASALEGLLSTRPVGLSLEMMNTRSAHLSSVIVNDYDRLKRKKTPDTPEFRMKMTRCFVQLNDARNYMLLGDPAVRLRIADA